ncbi:hypothetical protein FB451DRAFT_1524970 [Mycena latifolia]|nr:hypothetical protein FB451DRAFT_1524970 [Mycena latifolia]
MFRLSTGKNGITEKRFWNLPALGPSVHPIIQADASDAISSRSSQKQHTHLQNRTEGCLVTRFVDLSNEFAHFISAVRAKERQGEKQKIIDLLIHQLKVVPTSAATAPFTLEHSSNMSWLSIMLHKHHDNWATIAISPCLADMLALARWFTADNKRRQALIDYYGPERDPGRSSVDLCFETLTLEHQYTLTVLHPRHFQPHPHQSINILGTDGSSKLYWASPEGVLKDKDGVPLPPFSPSARPLLLKLNPLLVNFAAALRFRRLKRMDPALLNNFSPATHAVINASLDLYAAVMWTPVLPKQEEGSAVHVGTTDAVDVEMGAGPNPGTFQLFQTLGPMNAMEVMLGGYDFEPLPELVDDGENGVASPPRPTTPPDDEERWDLIPAEVSGTDSRKGPTESILAPLTGSPLCEWTGGLVTAAAAVGASETWLKGAEGRARESQG